jgi:hypothetical protein
MKGMYGLAVAGCLFALLASPAAAQAPLFSADDELALTLDAPFGRLVSGAARSTDPFPGTVTLGAASFAIEVAPRGFTRRTGDFCSFPPLRLNFERSALQGTQFEGQNRLKLVTHCRPQSSFAPVGVREYLAYRLYNLVTPLSFRVRPAQITYHDNEGRFNELTRFGFLIEDAGEMARRNDRVELEVAPGSVDSAQLDAASSANLALFQFMIGNLDWSYTSGPPGDDCCHNGKLLAREGETSGIVPVPYDFDFSGFVGASYATPPPSAPVSNVRTRYYWGLCRHNDQLPAAADLFRARRAAMAALIASETRLNEASRVSSQNYIADFFAILDDPERFDRLIVRRCRGVS